MHTNSDLSNRSGITTTPRPTGRRFSYFTSFRLAAFATALGLSWFDTTASGQSLVPGDLLVSRTTYEGVSSSVTVGAALPGGGVAVADGSSLAIFNNETPDPSFGITAPILIDQYNTGTNTVDNTINVTQLAAAQHLNLTTSFPSKSEIALNASTDGTAITFMGYLAAQNTLDVSNSNTPGHVDATNPVTSSYQRGIAQLNLDGTLSVTATNAYSGNNGRAAVLAGGNYYTVGNAGNGSGTEPTSIVSDTGVQTTTPGGSANTTVVGKQQGTPGQSTGFQYGYAISPADKSGKDDNFRGLTVFNNTLYVTKGSGSNGVNTVYQVGAAGSVNSLAANASTTPITILPGFNTTSAKTATTGPNPFGLFFANANTLYVADEGDGSDANSTFAGLEKWTFNAGTQKWQLAYTLTAGLNIGQAYTVSGTLANGTTGSITTHTDGLRNLTGQVNSDGTVTLYAVTSTYGSSVTDAGADPNKLVSVSDVLSSTTGTGETFTTLETAAYGDALRGVTVVPETSAVPEPATYAAFAGVAALGLAWLRRRRQQQA